MFRQLAKCVSTVVEMLADRGLDVEALDPGLLGMAQEEAWAAALRTSLTSICVPVQPPTLMLMVTLQPRPTAHILRSELKRHLQPYPTDATRDIIMVVLEKAPNFEQNITKLQSELRCRIQLFLLAELQFNLSRHTLVPRHQKVTDPEEVRRVMEGYSLRAKHQLPIILHTDPMARYLDLRPGELVRIHRLSPTSGEFLAYRCCV